MSKKLRNTIRPAFMRNFTRNTLERYILLEIDDMNNIEKDKFVSKINEKLWYAIQKSMKYPSTICLMLSLEELKT